MNATREVLIVITLKIANISAKVCPAIDKAIRIKIFFQALNSYGTVSAKRNKISVYALKFHKCFNPNVKYIQKSDIALGYLGM